MEHTQIPWSGTAAPEAPGGATPAFAAFVLAHEDCGSAVEESRLDADTLACRCPPCGETRVFRATRTKRRRP